jgi:hypothetical protein
MSRLGKMQDGVVVPVEPFPWPDGTEVTVAPVRMESESSSSGPSSTYERLKPLIGKAEGLPSDLAENHDHYLHGRPKQ